MKKIKILITIQFIAHLAFGQLDSDFINAKRSADYCFQVRNYACAKTQYQVALAIKENDVYCKERIAEIERKEIQLKKNKEEKAKYQAAQRSKSTTKKPYYGTLKAQYDENDEKFEYNGYIQDGQPEGHGIANYTAYDKNLGKEEGEWHDGKKYGYFKAKYPNGDNYEAEYKDGKLNGKMKWNYLESNYKAEFYFKNGKMYGLQKMYYQDFRVELFSLNGEFEGKATAYYNNGLVISGYGKNNNFIGEVNLSKDQEFSGVGFYKNGGLNGPAKFDYANGNKFDGNFKNDLPNGMGKLTYKNGDILEGYFDNSLTNFKGNVTISFANGNKYIGESGGGLLNGKGKMIYYDGSIYDGQWLNGLCGGYGTLTVNKWSEIKNCPKSITYIGWFLNDLKHGNGKCFGINGELIYNGKFENNKPIDKYPSKIKK